MKPLLVVFSGAGLSKESGIPTFRDSQTGLWHNHKVEDVASQDGWKRSHKVVLEFYQERIKNVRSAEPNVAHKAIARLQEKYKVINLTQNIDDLLERAGCEEVWHLHGDINHRKCEWHKSITLLDGDTKYTCDFRSSQVDAVTLGETCPKCGGAMRPDVVWFGEAVDMRMREIEEMAPRTDVFIGVGTSAQVHPAAGLLFLFRVAKQKYFIDPVPPLRLQSYTRLTGTASEHLPKLADELLK